MTSAGFWSFWTLPSPCQHPSAFGNPPADVSICPENSDYDLIAIYVEGAKVHMQLGTIPWLWEELSVSV